MLQPSVVFAAALALTTMASPLASQSENPGPRELPLLEARLDAWKGRTARIEQQLRDGDCRDARSSVDLLLEEITESLTGGPSAGAILAAPLRLRALASVCLLESRVALWDYHAAEALAPGSTAELLTSSGDLGTKLATLLREEEEESLARGREALPKEMAAAMKSGRLTPPKQVKVQRVEYPKSLRGALKTGTAIVSGSIDTDGYLKQPTLREGTTPNAVFLYSALKAARDFLFQPSTYDGKPVPMYYSLNVKYKLKG